MTHQERTRGPKKGKRQLGKLRIRGVLGSVRGGGQPKKASVSPRKGEKGSKGQRKAKKQLRKKFGRKHGRSLIKEKREGCGGREGLGWRKEKD